MNKKTPIWVGVVLIVGILIGYFTMSIPYYLTKATIENNVKTFYELIYPGGTADVVSLDEQSGVYHAFVKLNYGGQITYQELFVTKDGKLLTTSDSTILLQNSITQIEKQKSFIQCLQNKGVKIYGISNQTAPGGSSTLLQLNVLGTIYSPQLFVSCDGTQVLNCVNANISVVPSIVIGSTVTPGVQPINWFVNNTGCSY